MPYIIRILILIRFIIKMIYYNNNQQGNFNQIYKNWEK